MLLCADTELKHLYHSKYIVCDGTFQMAPESSYQGYMETPLQEGNLALKHNFETNAWQWARTTLPDSIPCTGLIFITSMI